MLRFSDIENSSKGKTLWEKTQENRAEQYKVHGSRDNTPSMFNPNFQKMPKLSREEISRLNDEDDAEIDKLPTPTHASETRTPHLGYQGSESNEWGRFYEKGKSAYTPLGHELMSNSYFNPAVSARFSGPDYIHLGDDQRSYTKKGYPYVSPNYMGKNPNPHHNPYGKDYSNSAFSGDKSQAHLDRELEEYSEKLKEHNKPVTWGIDKGTLDRFNKKKGGRKSRKSRKTRRSRKSRKSRK
jgi:hypothetical protein